MNKKNIYIFILLYLSPFIDSISGYLILSGALSDDGSAATPSQFFRLALIIFSFYIIKKYKKIFFYNIGFLMYLVCIELVAWFLHQSPEGLIIGLTWTSKLAFLSLVFSSLYTFSLDNRVTFMSLLWHIRNNILISSVLLLIAAIFSLGFSTYIEGTFGTKGFFASGNGLGVYLGTGLLLSIYYWKMKPSIVSYLLILVVLSAVLVIGTKSALAFSVFGFLVLISLAKKSYTSLVTVIFSAIAIVLYKNELLDTFAVMFDVITYRFEHNDSTLAYTFSGRDVKFERAFDEYNIDGLYALRILTGFGSFVSFHDISLSKPSFFTMESDFFELFFMYGIIGISTYFYIFLLLFFKSRKNKLLFIFFSIWFVHSLVAGHSLFNGMSGIWLPLIAVLILLKNRNQRHNRSKSKFI